MKPLQNKPIVLILLLALTSMLFSFAPFGGEGYQVFINKKLVLERFGQDMNVIKTLQLEQYPPDAQLTIRYYHCGKAGKSRTVTLKDDNNRIIKQWKFKDEEGVVGVSCPVKEITDLQKKFAVINLYYASSELPAGRQLAALSNSAVAVKK